MKKYFLLITIIGISLLFLISCDTSDNSSRSSENTKDVTPDNTSDAGTDEVVGEEGEPFLKKITSSEAKDLMDNLEDYIVLDVRTEEEFQTGHIEGAILLPDYEVEAKAEEVLPDKKTPILVYCRSGRRSASAAKLLYDLGYSSVYDFGGIIDWPYSVVTD